MITFKQFISEAQQPLNAHRITNGILKGRKFDIDNTIVGRVNGVTLELSKSPRDAKRGYVNVVGHEKLEAINIHDVDVYLSK